MGQIAGTGVRGVAITAIAITGREIGADTVGTSKAPVQSGAFYTATSGFGDWLTVGNVVAKTGTGTDGSSGLYIMDDNDTGSNKSMYASEVGRTLLAEASVVTARFYVKKESSTHTIRIGMFSSGETGITQINRMFLDTASGDFTVTSGVTNATVVEQTYSGDAWWKVTFDITLTNSYHKANFIINPDWSSTLPSVSEAEDASGQREITVDSVSLKSSWTGEPMLDNNKVDVGGDLDDASSRISVANATTTTGSANTGGITTLYSGVDDSDGLNTGYVMYRNFNTYALDIGVTVTFKLAIKQDTVQGNTQRVLVQPRPSPFLDDREFGFNHATGAIDARGSDWDTLTVTTKTYNGDTWYIINGTFDIDNANYTTFDIQIYPAWQDGGDLASAADPAATGSIVVDSLGLV